LVKIHSSGERRGGWVIGRARPSGDDLRGLQQVPHRARRPVQNDKGVRLVEIDFRNALRSWRRRGTCRDPSTALRTTGSGIEAGLFSLERPAEEPEQRS
jgi:hypothetical protein